MFPIVVSVDLLTAAELFLLVTALLHFAAAIQAALAAAGWVVLSLLVGLRDGARWAMGGRIGEASEGFLGGRRPRLTPTAEEERILRAGDPGAAERSVEELLRRVAADRRAGRL